MKLLFDACWRAAAYCLRPRVIALSIWPLVLMALVFMGLGFFLWNPALELVRQHVETLSFMSTVWSLLESVGLGRLKGVFAPLVVVLVVTPVIVMACLLVASVMMTPALTRIVAEQRFPLLEQKRGAGLVRSAMWSLVSTLLAVIATVATSPLWFVPPMVFVLPPLIWGWLTYRVMAFDALADFASADERREVFRRHRGRLLAIGVMCGFLGAAPSVIWVFGVTLAVAFFVVLVPLAVWVYTLVFAFSSLWFAHYALAALNALRAETQPAKATALPVAPGEPTGVSPMAPLAPPSDPAST